MTIANRELSFVTRHSSLIVGGMSGLVPLFLVEIVVLVVEVDQAIVEL